jgi:glycosyltransferase involved in cell wall biosynthesis
MIGPIYIVSSGIGKAGGADRVTYLLAKQYADLGYKVKVFATACEDLSSKQVSISGPLLNIGHRFKFPQYSLILKILFHSLISKPLFIHSIGLTIEVRLLLKFLHTLKIIVWETTESKPNNKFIDSQINKYLKNASLILVPSSTIRRNFIETFNYKKRIEILPFWVEWLPNSITQNIRNRKLLYFGRMDQDKGIDCLIEAFKSLPSNLDLTLNICGRGKTDYIDNLVLNQSKINIHGWVNDEILKDFILHSDFVILPSLHEGYPLSLIESCGYGKPIIATSVGSIPEVFENSKAGLLFTPGNHEELARILNYCYDESDADYALRCNGARELYEGVNSLSKISDQLKKIVTSMKCNEGN